MERVCDSYGMCIASFDQVYQWLKGFLMSGKERITASELTSDSLLQLLFSVNMKKDNIITDFKSADSRVNRFLERLRWKMAVEVLNMA